MEVYALPLLDAVEQGLLVLGRVGVTQPEQHLVEYYSQRPNVGPVIVAPSAEDLRGLGVWSADYRSGHSLLADLRQPEVGYFNSVVFSDEDVAQLDVPMNNQDVV